MSGYALMWSGGKDSALALWRARRKGLRIAWLVNVHDRATGRVRFHATPVAAIALQAEAAGIPLVSVPTDWEPSTRRCARHSRRSRNRAVAGSYSVTST